MAILADQAAVENEANQRGSLWKENGEYRSPIGPPPDDHFLPLMPMAVRDAADSFPINIALGATMLLQEPAAGFARLPFVP